MFNDVKEAFNAEARGRDPGWSEILAGRREFVEQFKAESGIGTRHRQVSWHADHYTLREAQAAYRGDFDPEMAVLSGENRLFWRVNTWLARSCAGPTPESLGLFAPNIPNNDLEFTGKIIYHV